MNARIFLCLCFIFIACHTRAQDAPMAKSLDNNYDYWSVKIPLANTIDFYSSPNFMVAVERRLNKKTSLQGTAGISIDPCANCGGVNGFRLKAAYKRYFHTEHKYSFFLAGELFYTQFRKTIDQSYLHMPDSTVYEGHFIAFTQKYGADVQFGLHKVSHQHFTLDIYAGLGLQQVVVSQKGRLYPNDPIHYYPAVDFHFDNSGASEVQNGIQGTMPINIAIGYIF